MRVIAGKFKGRKLEVPKTTLRPTLDRTKETLFNLLQTEVPEARVLDIFSGSGSLGIEALSRGAESCVFVEINKDAAKVIKANCEKCGCLPQSSVLNLSYDSAIGSLKQKFDIVFADPPYHEGLYYGILKRLEKSDILSDDAIVVLEHDTENELPDSVGNLSKYRVKSMGKCSFSFYQVVEDKQ